MTNPTPTGNQPAYSPLEAFDFETIPDLFFKAIDRYDLPDALRFKRRGTWRQLSHREVEKQVGALAAALDAVGFQPGERVALLSENRPEWAVTDYAVLCLGGVDVPIYPTLPGGQVAYILNDSGAKVVFVSTRAQFEKIQSIRTQVPSVEWVVVFDEIEDLTGATTFSSLIEEGQRRIEAGSASDLREKARSIARDDLATLIYTSGTTGQPKGVMLSHYNIASQIAATEQSGSLPVETGQVALSLLPLSHIFERAVDYYYGERGLTIAYAESIENVADNLKEVRPHVMVSVPRLFEKIHATVMGSSGAKGKIARWAGNVGEEWAQRAVEGKPVPAGLALKHRVADRLVFSKIRERVGGRMHTFISGGAPLSAQVNKFFYAAGLRIHEGYGLTETSPVLASNRPNARRFGSVGVPYPGVEVKTSEEGEIIARGPNVMKGYWNQPEATRQAIDEEGWFHTGDLGEFDADGFLYITGRIKDIIVTAGGKNIAPQPIENHATSSPYVAQAVMIGDRRPFPIMLVVPDWQKLSAWAREHSIDISDRLQAIRDVRIQEFFEREVLNRLQGFARYELPKKLSLLAEEFTVDLGTLTPTLKIRRQAIEQAYRALIDQLYLQPLPA